MHATRIKYFNHKDSKLLPLAPTSLRDKVPASWWWCGRPASTRRRSRRRRTSPSGRRWGGASPPSTTKPKKNYSDSESVTFITKWSRWSSFNHCQPKVQQLSPYPSKQCFSNYSVVSQDPGWEPGFKKKKERKKGRKEKQSALTCGKGKFCIVKFLFLYINMQSESWHKTFLTWRKVKKVWKHCLRALLFN